MKKENRKEIVIFVKKKINFVSPTEIKLFWRNDITTEGESYSGHIPESNPIDSNYYMLD